MQSNNTEKDEKEKLKYLERNKSAIRTATIGLTIKLMYFRHDFSGNLKYKIPLCHKKPR